MSNEHFDAIVVGSGFGGSTMAYRMAEAGWRVLLLERGKPFPPGSFPRDPAGMKGNFWEPKDGLHGMFDLWSFKHLDSLVSSGLGGGSLIYANVLLRKDEKWFVRDEPGKPGWEYWMVNRQDLDPHYDQVERMMHAQEYPLGYDPYDGTMKTLAMREAAQALGLDWDLVNLAVTFRNEGDLPIPGEPIREAHRNLHDRTRYTCRLCGECDAGCNYGSKNTLDYTYLSEAKRLGAEIRTLAEVKEFFPNASGGGYTVQYVEHTLGEATPSGAKRTVVTADVVVLGAGTYGSTNLLMRNRAFFPGVNQKVLGTHYCGNGDLLTFAMNAKHTVGGKKVPRELNGSFGPVITSAIRMGDAADGAPHTGRGFYIEDAGYPGFANWLLETGNRAGLVKRGLHFGLARLKSALGIGHSTNIGKQVADLLGACTLSTSSVPMLGMGRDVPDGKLFLDGECLESDWKIGGSDEYFGRMQKTMKAIAKHLDADFVDNPIWYLGTRVITVHPLGGTPMGRNAEEGVVDEWGEVYNHPGLYVADGSVMPGPVGANPSLTIAAMANRFADRLIEKRGRKVPALKVFDADVPAKQPTA
jgi:cholesterol oxidase